MTRLTSLPIFIGCVLTAAFLLVFAATAFGVPTSASAELDIDVPSAGDITDVTTDVANSLLDDVLEAAEEAAESQDGPVTHSSDAGVIVCDTFEYLEDADVLDAPASCDGGADGGNGDGGNGDGGSGGDGDNGDGGGNGDGDDGSDDDNNGGGDSGDNGAGDGGNGDGGDGNGDGGSGGGSGGSSFSGDTGATDEEDSEGGTSVDVLNILNEIIVRLSEDTFRVTWDTDADAWGSIVFGTESVDLDDNENLAEPHFGYQFTLSSLSGTTTEHTALLQLDLPITDMWYVRPVATHNATRAFGEELVLLVGGALESGQCTAYINGFIEPGEDNDPEEVRKLQRFLQSEGFDIAETGIYDEASIAAVEAFQAQHGGDILEPWGIGTPTGFVYLTTRKKINEIHCENQLEFPLSAEEESEIASFRSGNQTLDGRVSDIVNVNNSPVGAESNSASSDALVEEDGEANGEAQVAGAAQADQDSITFSLLRGIREDISSIFGAIRNLLPGGGEGDEEAVEDENEGTEVSEEANDE